MKKVIIISATVVALVAVVALMPRNSCDASSGKCETSQSSSKKAVQASDVLGEVEAGEARLIDVREKDEFETGHAPRAELIPVGDIVNGKLDESDKGKKLYLYCRSGNRAGQALSALKSQGYANVVNLGGLSDWSSMGGEIVK